MKVKFQQYYFNECGECALKNLLSLFKIKKFKEIKNDIKGLNLLDIKNYLLNYFKDVELIYISKKNYNFIEKILPTITLINYKNHYHYIVIYKHKKEYFYVLDSLYKKNYKISLYKLIELWSGYFVKIDEKSI